MTIQWMFTPPGDAGRDDSNDGLTSTTSEHAPLDGTHGSALHDLLPSVLALLDFESIRQLSGTCRAAARSSVRAHALERSVVQLSPSSVAVHDMLRCMALRSHLRSMEIRDCLTPPRAIGDLPTLLASVKRVKFADEPKLDREVLDEASRIGRESGVARKMGRTEYVRHVRRRLNEEHRTMYPREFADGSPQVATELAPWFSALNPALLVEIDFGKMRIDDLGWLRLFPSLKKLQFDASSDFPSGEYLKPLMSAASLEELVITRLMVRDCKELAALGSLRKLELRGAPKIRSIDFLRCIGKLECLVLTEMIVSDLSPLLHLTALRDLTLDSIAFTSADLFRDGASHPVPAFPQLESIQIVFTGMAMDCLLCHAPRLMQLHLCDSRLESWRPLQTLSRLEQISVSVDGVDDWSALAGLPYLTRLALDSRHGHVKSRHFGTGWRALEEVISPPWDDYTRLVEGARRLRRLQLLGWRSRDSSSLSVLKSARNLRTLWIAFLPGPVELSTVGELHQLQSLELWNASVVTIEFLRGLENLVELKLASPFRAGVEIINFAPLGQLKKLQTLALSGRREFKNVNLEVLAQLPKLKNVDVSNSGVTPSYQRKLQTRYNTQASKSSTRSPLAPAMR